MLVNQSGGFGIKVLAPEGGLTCQDRHLALGLPESGSGFHGDEPAADHHDVAFQRGHFPERLRVGKGAQVDDVTQVAARDGRPERAAAGGKAGFFELDGLPVAQHGEMAVNVELGHYRVEPQIDLVLLVPGGGMMEHFLEGVLLVAEEALGKGAALIGWMHLVADERDFATFVVLTDAFANADTRGASPDDQIIAFDHGLLCLYFARSQEETRLSARPAGCKRS